MKTIEVYGISDIVERALQITDANHCGSSEHCPKCRAAKATGQLNEEMGLPFDFADGMLRLLCIGIPHLSMWSKYEADAALRGRLAELSE